MNIIEPNKIRIDRTGLFGEQMVDVDVLRLDLLHPVISGNKWYKLKNYLAEAVKLRKKTLLTFGGAWSNHIVAAAAAAQAAGIESAAIIRGEKPQTPSATILEAENYGMRLYYTSRDDYRKKFIPPELTEEFQTGSMYVVKEGGYGIKGAEGASDILQEQDISPYTHIIAAVGTGTMLAGLALAKHQEQQLIGIPVLKNYTSLQTEIEEILPEGKRNEFTLIHGYHFGGYARHTPALTGFMNDWYQLTGIPSDFVYTGKLFFAIQDLVIKNYFPKRSRLLLIHSGGLQGNRSLPKGTLIF